MTFVTRLSLVAVATVATAAVVYAGMTAYRQLGASRPRVHGTPGFSQAVEVGRIKNPAVTESSGIAASRRNPGRYWTHNDSGGRPQLFAIDEKGSNFGSFLVTGAKAFDWEDIAVAPGADTNTSYIYVGDIGDNLKTRDEIVVYRVAEPSIGPSNNTKRSTPTVAVAAIRLAYPDGKHDCEALLVHPTTGDVYVITKTLDDTARVYAARAPLATSKRTTLEFVATIRVPSLFGSTITGADISSDGRHVVLANYLGAYELSLDDNTSAFDAIWKLPLASISIPARPQGESICYSADGNKVLLTSEGASSPIWVARRRTRR